MTQQDILGILDNILSHSKDTEEKLSGLLKNIVFLESGLDELLEKAQGEEKADILRENDSIRSFFSELIPVLDELDRLRRVIMESGRKEWKRGMRILFDKMAALLDSHDFRMSARTGMEFNPSHHESVGTELNPRLPAGSVSDVIENGWLYKGSILRYAKVTVVKENK